MDQIDALSRSSGGRDDWEVFNDRAIYYIICLMMSSNQIWKVVPSVSLGIILLTDGWQVMEDDVYVGGELYVY